MTATAAPFSKFRIWCVLGFFLGCAVPGGYVTAGRFSHSSCLVSPVRVLSARVFQATDDAGDGPDLLGRLACAVSPLAPDARRPCRGRAVEIHPFPPETGQFRLPGSRSPPVL
ncbi:MAG: hypothetical protein DRH56_04100 [Deltaproteobacteria bacterium]|nr:MAG: hypothetical protein DRH56_04100 [Deltaproteobacteria bacterium]